MIVTRKHFDELRISMLSGILKMENDIEAIFEHKESNVVYYTVEFRTKNIGIVRKKIDHDKKIVTEKMIVAFNDKRFCSAISYFYDCYGCAGKMIYTNKRWRVVK